MSDKKQLPQPRVSHGMKENLELVNSVSGVKSPGIMDKIFIHVRPINTCAHDFQGWREFDDGHGGEQVCTKCGMGAMAHTLSMDF